MKNTVVEDIWNKSKRDLYPHPKRWTLIFYMEDPRSYSKDHGKTDLFFLEKRT